jgi:intracellular sulfur oxidation DsrE/DsrF family protein
MKKGLLAAFMVVAGLFGTVLVQPAMADGKTHHLAIHVDENDPAKMNIALNNAANVTKYYKSKGENVEIEIVAYGPGLHMYRADTSPVKGRIAAMSLENEHIKFSACGNTLAGMTKKEGKKPELISEAQVVPSGVVRLIELQEEGYTYVRP